MTHDATTHRLYVYWDRIIAKGRYHAKYYAKNWTAPLWKILPTPLLCGKSEQKCRFVHTSPGAILVSKSIFGQIMVGLCCLVHGGIMSKYRRGKGWTNMKLHGHLHTISSILNQKYQFKTLFASLGVQSCFGDKNKYINLNVLQSNLFQFF